MNAILAKQEVLQFAIAKNHGHTVLTTDEPVSKLEVAKFIQQQLSHLQFEVAELLEEIGDGNMAIVKPWSKAYSTFDEEEFVSNDSIKSEAMDIFCFCMNIVLAAGITPNNIEEEFSNVWDKNMSRQKEGY